MRFLRNSSKKNVRIWLKGSRMLPHRLPIFGDVLASKDIFIIGRNPVELMDASRRPYLWEVVAQGEENARNAVHVNRHHFRLVMKQTIVSVIVIIISTVNMVIVMISKFIMHFHQRTVQIHCLDGVHRHGDNNKDWAQHSKVIRSYINAIIERITYI